VSKKVIAAIVAVAVVVVAVLVAVSLSGGDDAPSASERTTAGDEATSLVADLPQNGGVLGNPDAPVSIVEYVDFKCPVCAEASETIVPEVIRNQVTDGTATIELRPIAFIGPDSERGALAALAAAEQDRMWQFSETLLATQGDEQTEWITDEVVRETAEAAGLDMDRWQTAFDGEAVVDQFLAAKNSASTDNVSGTPFFVVSGPGGTESFSGLVAQSRIDEAIASALGSARPAGPATTTGGTTTGE
jgi:protein-disulfide isomerase